MQLSSQHILHPRLSSSRFTTATNCLPPPPSPSPPTPTMTLAHTLAQQLLAALLLFQTGALYSLGVFNGAIEAAAPALRGVWAGSMGLMSLFGLPSMLLSGLYVTEGRAAPAPWHACRTPRIRIIVALGAASFATTAAAAVAVAAGRGRLLSAIVAGLGLAYGNCKFSSPSRSRVNVRIGRPV